MCSRSWIMLRVGVSARRARARDRLHSERGQVVDHAASRLARASAAIVRVGEPACSALRGEHGKSESWRESGRD